MINPLRTRLRRHWQKAGDGIYSVCSANPFVLEAAILQAKQDGSILLIESTSNQVDQYGGYSGMTPNDFLVYINNLARRLEINRSRILLGGDHLGPNVWQGEPAETAMGKAHEQIRAYVAAGFIKIHLDTSMPLAGDAISPAGIISAELIAERAAQLCVTAEKTSFTLSRTALPPVYVIGTDVPIPGGAQHDLTAVELTTVDRVHQTIDSTYKAFLRHGMAQAWKRVIAVVVQPGVEFSDSAVIGYNHRQAANLSKFISRFAPLVYEAHSTDYQQPALLDQMVRDHFAILKVGPWFTFELRRAVFGLAQMEEEYLGRKKSVDLSQMRESLDKSMIDKPVYWQKHYHGNAAEQAFARAYSYSDRVRYYWPEQPVQEALNRLLQNLQINPPPLNLICQYFPDQYWKIREGILTNHPVEIIHDCIRGVVKFYARATGMLKE